MSDSTLLPEQEQLLCRLVEARNRRLPGREPFHSKTDYSGAADVAILIHKGWPKDSAPVHLSDLEALAAGGYILRKSLGNGWKFELTGKALSLHESLRQPARGNACPKATPDSESGSPASQSRTQPPAEEHASESLEEASAPAIVGQGEDLDEPERTPADAESLIAAADSGEATEERVFRKDGEMWTICFGGETKHFKDTKGMRCLWLLIANEGEGFTPLEMVEAVERLSAADVGGAVSESRAEQEGLNTAGPTDAGKVMTRPYSREVRQRVLDLIERKKEAVELGNEEEQIATQTELEELERQHTRWHGPRGRPRKADDQNLRLRKSVCENIRRAELRIKPEFPRLFRHLRYSIKKSPLFAYRPDESLGWHCW